MSKTDNPKPNPVNNHTSSGDQQPVIRSLDHLSAWIDEQLLLLESRHQDFETAGSIRGYYQR